VAHKAGEVAAKYATKRVGIGLVSTLAPRQITCLVKVLLGMRATIYARVSTKGKGQDTENQLHQLRAFAEQHGEVYQVFTDEASGGKADRAEFKQQLLEAYKCAPPVRLLRGRRRKWWQRA
jgi:hypothetical protein